MEVYDKISEKYDYIYVLANSIGAYFTMHTLQNFKIEKALFISPILDMEQLIIDMMSWANVVKRNFLKEKKYQLILEKHYRGNIYVLFGQTR